MACDPRMRADHDIRADYDEGDIKDAIDGMTIDGMTIVD